MQKTRNKQLLSRLVCLVLIAAAALSMAGCAAKTDSGTPAQSQVLAAGSYGEGAVSFQLVVADKDGNETEFAIHTDRQTVGEALLELGLIAGEESDYGLYVKTVNGLTADYDADGTYWAFYIDGEYASTGVDATPVTEGATYSLRVE